MRTTVFYDDSVLAWLFDADKRRRIKIGQTSHLIAKPDGTIIDTYAETVLLHESRLDLDAVADAHLGEEFGV